MVKQGLIPFDKLSVLYVLGRFSLTRTAAPRDLLPFLAPDMPRFPRGASAPSAAARRLASPPRRCSGATRGSASRTISAYPTAPAPPQTRNWSAPRRAARSGRPCAPNRGRPEGGDRGGDGTMTARRQRPRRLRVPPPQDRPLRRLCFDRHNHINGILVKPGQAHAHPIRRHSDSPFSPLPQIDQISLHLWNTQAAIANPQTLGQTQGLARTHPGLPLLINHRRDGTGGSRTSLGGERNRHKDLKPMQGAPKRQVNAEDMLAELKRVLESSTRAPDAPPPSASTAPSPALPGPGDSRSQIDRERDRPAKANAEKSIGRRTDLQKSTRPRSRRWKLIAGGLALAGAAAVCASFALMNKAPELAEREPSVAATESLARQQNERIPEPSSPRQLGSPGIHARPAEPSRDVGDLAQDRAGRGANRNSAVRARRAQFIAASG